MTDEAIGHFVSLDRAEGRGVFGADPAGYHSARIGAPPALIEKVLARVPASAPDVLEIGPGTGLATEALLAGGAGALTALEPDRALADYLVRRIDDSRLSVTVSGFVEAEIAADFDLACAACSFHWVDQDLGFAKLLRILKPGGTIALWWHSYRNRGLDPFFDALSPDLADMPLPPSEGRNGYVYLDEAAQRATMAGHGFEEIEFEIFRTERLLDAGQLCSLYASFSFVRLLPSDLRRRLLSRIVEIVEKDFGGLAPNLVLTPLYIAKSPVKRPAKLTNS